MARMDMQHNSDPITSDLFDAYLVELATLDPAAAAERAEEITEWLGEALDQEDH